MVPTGLADEPPLIISNPGLVGTIEELFTYDITALDPEGQAVTLTLENGPTGASIIDSQLRWTPTSTDLGDYPITILATDPAGNPGRQSFNLTIRPVNTPPVFQTDPVTDVAVGERYLYASLATDTDDSVIYSVDGPMGITVNETSGLVSWDPTLVVSGNYPITLTATDARGLSTDQPYTLVVSPDTEAPDVSIILSNGRIGIGEAYEVQVVASDNVAVASIELVIDGVPVTLDTEGRATITPTIAGIPELTATATDTAGNIGTATDSLFVIDFSDVTPPTVEITSPINNATIEYLTDVFGTVTDDNLASYTLEVSLINTGQWKTIATASVPNDGTNIELNNEFVAVFDPTLLKNNQYDLRLTASDTVGNTSTDTIRVSLDGMAKVGVNNHPVIDLMIPVAGGPSIAIHRQHSQLDVDLRGDFGNGWQFCTAEPDIRETVARTEFEELLGQFAAIPFAEGDKVYITTPDCQRAGFTFSPVPHTGIWSTLGDNFYDPRWVPDPGVTWRLYGQNDFTTITSLTTGVFDLDGLPLPLNRLANGEYILAAVFASYNPLGYELVSKHGVRYSYDQDDGLTNVVDRNGNTLEYSEAGITSSSGQQVQFQRDDQGRVRQVIDPDGYQYDYFYDDAGNLIDVQYPNGTSNSYAYTAQNFLAAVNPDDLPEQEYVSTGFEYDVLGRLTVMTDALGATNIYEYQIDDNTRVTYDALGAPTEIEYDDRGNMIREKSANDNTAFYQYDINDNLTVITDERGFDTEFTYDGNRNVTSVTDALGNRTQFMFDEFSVTTQMIQADGGVHTYDIDENGNITRIRMPGGTDASIEYDDIGRVISVTDIDGGVKRLEYGDLAYPTKSIERDGTFMEMTYDSRGKLTSSTDHNGNTTTYQMDQRNRPDQFINALGGTVSYGYDGSVLSSITDEVGNTTSYIYDGNNRPIQITNPAGGITQVTYDPNGRTKTARDENGNQVSYTYREDGRLVAMTNEQGGVTSYEYDPAGNRIALTDPNGNRWQWEFDAIGYAVAEIDPNGDRTDFEFDSMGNMISETDALGRVTQFEFGEIQLPTRIINADGHEMSFVYDWQGNLLSESDLNGNVHTYAYDQRNRLLTTTDPYGESVTYAYDAVGNTTGVTNKRGFSSLSEYDELNRAVILTDATGASEVLEYDAKGRVVRTADPTGAETIFVHDELDRVVKRIDPLSGEWNYTYDAVGNLLTSTDQLGRTTVATYDSLNRRVSTTDPRGGVTSFQYDPNGNVTSITDPTGNSTTFEFDYLDRAVRVTDELGNFSTNDYDAVGNLVEMVDRNGRKLIYQYDDLNRVRSETWTTALGTVENTISYDYDQAGNLLSASDFYSSYTYTYDDLHRATTVDNVGTPRVPRVVLTNVFDSIGNRTSVVDNAGVSIANAYDSRNLLTERIWSGGGISDASVRYEYDSRAQISNLKRFQSSNDSVVISETDYQYDVKSRLASLSHKNAIGEVLVNYDYERDLADQLVREIHHGQTVEYTRDAGGQLLNTIIDGAVEESYSYDLSGNRISGGTVTGVDNRLLSDANDTYEYDAEGNLIRRTDNLSANYTTYSFDNRNRLVQSVEHDLNGEILSTSNFTYDLFDRLIVREYDADGPGPTTESVLFSVYDGPNVWSDYDDTGAVTSRYLYNDGVDQIAARWSPQNGTGWYLSDRLGTVREILDSVGAIVNELVYDSYGRILTQSNPEFGDRFTYTGREWDEALGLYYYRARFYDPAMGRFISQDPIGFSSGDANLYRYVGNNPIDHVDPSGNLAVTECAVYKAATIALDLLCPAIQNYLKGEYKGKSWAEIGTLNIVRVAFGTDLRMTKTNTDGEEVALNDDELLALSIEKTMHMLNVTAAMLPGGAAMAFQLTMKSMTMAKTAEALAGRLANTDMFNVMGQAETWMRGAYALAKNPGATMAELLQASRRYAEQTTALQWSELVCGAANLALMVFSARGRCFVAGTPIVVEVNDDRQEHLKLPSVVDSTASLTLFDALGGAALAGGLFLISDRGRVRRKQSQEVDDFSWLFASDTGRYAGSSFTCDLDDDLLSLLAFDSHH